MAAAEVPQAFPKLPGLCRRRDIGENIMPDDVCMVNLLIFFHVRAVIEDGAVGRDFEQAEGKNVETCLFFKLRVKRGVAGVRAYL